jgi:hypothetical protein
MPLRRVEAGNVREKLGRRQLYARGAAYGSL